MANRASSQATHFDVHSLTSLERRADGRSIISGVDITASAGSLTAVAGPSGAGKSTLIDLVSGIELPCAGTVTLGSTPMHPARSTQRARLRARVIATARQSEDLIDALSVEENVLLGQRLARRVDRSLREATLRAVGLEDALDHTPVRSLSGGERRRVAVARAVASGNPFIVADEPTSALDASAAAAVRSVLRQVADSGRTVVVVTHDVALAAVSDQVVVLADGAVAAVLDHPTPGSVRALTGEAP